MKLTLEEIENEWEPSKEDLEGIRPMALIPGKVLKELCRLSKAALSSAPQGWRDIKDAPKDGTYFWACNRIDIWKVYWDGKWYEGDEKSRPFLGWLPFAAAFPPLPAAPATKEG